MEYLDNSQGNAVAYNNDLSDFDADFAVLSNEEPAPGVLSESKMKEYILITTLARVPVLRKFLKAVKIPCAN